MNIKLKILLILCAFVSQTQAQTYFNRLYDARNWMNASSSIIETTNNDFMFIGMEGSGSYRAISIFKITALGDTLWSKYYPKPQHIYYSGISGSLIKNFDNNYSYGGTIVDINDATNTGDALLVKLTEDGDTLWTKKYGGASLDIANIVHQTADSGFVLIGSTSSFGVGSGDFYLIKTDKNGNFEWQKTYGTSATEDCVSGQITLDGGFILSGHRSDQLHIVKTDSAGNFQWEKVYAGTAGQGFIKQLADSTYILVGAKYISASVYKAYMAKLSKTGNIIWQNTYGGAGNQQFYAIPIILSDGSIVCSGVSLIPNVWGMLVKVDSMGNQQWLRTYYANSSGNNYVYDVKTTSDNGFILVGSGNLTGQDAWVVKVDEFGCEVSNCNVGVEEYDNDDLGFLIYPNPASTSITIESIKYQVQSIKILDLLGREYYFSNSHTTAIDIGYLPKGMYILQIQTEKGMFSKKWVKE